MTLINRKITTLSDEELLIYVYAGDESALAEYERRQEETG